ncbi:ABC transporter permease [Marinilabilia salmonicolor]|uniref:ABC-type lipoprotein release transport system permease subunit n=1 Tax=Marinilabilia salmonicolor TaxID=989 RepID=A0A368ULZ1_9BACT|nr:ABC transporter permease [Marinilabilia salmonicolor]RCW29817.1 ABC-type lipoprotein release transport system permease subunit [Marinilabilia salmonicolor]
MTTQATSGGFKSIVKIAWRNLWRNKKRTLITASSIFFGVILSALMGSMQEGSYQKMIENVARFYAGHAQIQHKDYPDNQSINNSFVPSDSLIIRLNHTDGIDMVVPRLESFALASSGNQTEGVMVLGVKPEQEDQMTKLSDKIVEGNYFNGPSQLLAGKELAENLGISPGDTLVMISQGLHGVSAFGKYPVAGLFSHPNPELNRQLVYLPLDEAMYFFQAFDHVTSLALVGNSQKAVNKAIPEINQNLEQNLVLRTWQEMFPAILQQIESDRATALIMKLILYLVIGFGILGTVVMLMAERQHELSVMVAVGMYRSKLALMLLLEILWMGVMGVIAGFIGSLPVIAWFASHPVPITGQAGEWMKNIGFEPYMFFAWDVGVFLEQMLVVFVLTLLISFYPFVRAFKISPIVGLRN